MLPKMLCKNPKRIKKVTLRLLSLSVWGAPASLGTKDKTERVSFNSYQTSKAYFYCKMNANATFPRLNQSRLSSPTQASMTWCFFKTFGWDPIMKQLEQHCQRWFITSWVVPQEKLYFVSTCRIEWWLVWGTWHQLSVMGEFFPRPAVGSPLSPGDMTPPFN